MLRWQPENLWHLLFMRYLACETASYKGALPNPKCKSPRMPPCSSRALTIWLTGLPSSGKSTLGSILVEKLQLKGEAVELLDGDVIRAQSPKKLGFSREDREKNLRHIASLADSLTRNGVTAVVASICPFRDLRNEFRDHLSPFLEVFVNAPVPVCEQRDVKGLYRRYRAGELKGLTGIDDIYEAPLMPDVECRTDLETVDESIGKILDAMSLIGTTDKTDQMANHQVQFNDTP